MSIIYEALKKIDRNSLNQKKNSFNEFKPDKTRFFLKAGIFIIVFVSIVGLVFILKGKYSGNSVSSNISFIQPETISNTKSLNKEIPRKPAEPKSQKIPAEFSLQGIVFSGGEYMALINQRLVAEGDMIGEASVKKIEADGVEIEINNKLFRLEN